MACIIEIKKDLNNSIDKILGGYRDSSHSYYEAQRRAKEINARWADLATVSRFGNDTAKIKISDTVFEKVANESFDSQKELESELDDELGAPVEESTDEVFDTAPEIIESEESVIEKVEEEHPIQTAYKAQLEKTGEKPKMIIITGTKAILNSNGTYDLVDPSNNTIMQKNMDLDTMEIIDVPDTSMPYDDEIFDNFVKNTLMHPYTEVMLAERGIDINDIYDELSVITTENELNEIMGKILKSVC